MALRNKRRAAIERGEKYAVAKKKRQLTLWERMTGVIVTKEDEDYDDCLSAEERHKIEIFRRMEMGENADKLDFDNDSQMTNQSDQSAPRNAL